jgi:flagellar biosynthetic protein FliQ
VTQQDILHLGAQAMILSFKLSAPILLVSLAIGVLISLVQAVTQVQEMTLSFVPKLAGIALVFVVAGGWMLQQMIAFTTQLFQSIPRLVQGG